jgi:hypothetical protein
VSWENLAWRPADASYPEGIAPILNEQDLLRSALEEAVSSMLMSSVTLAGIEVAEVTSAEVLPPDFMVVATFEMLGKERTPIAVALDPEGGDRLADEAFARPRHATPVPDLGLRRRPHRAVQPRGADDLARCLLDQQERQVASREEVGLCGAAVRFRRRDRLLAGDPGQQREKPPQLRQRLHDRFVQPLAVPGLRRAQHEALRLERRRQVEQDGIDHRAAGRRRHRATDSRPTACAHTLRTRAC